MEVVKEENQKEVEKYEVTPAELDVVLKEELQVFNKVVQGSIVRILQSTLKPVFKQ